MKLEIFKYCRTTNTFPPNEHGAATTGGAFHKSDAPHVHAVAIAAAGVRVHH